MQFILIEPDVRRSGWGIVKFSDLIQVREFSPSLECSAFLFSSLRQDVEVSQDKDDNHSLQILIHKPVHNIHAKSNPPVLNTRITFDDHIRRMTAEQNLRRAREK